MKRMLMRMALIVTLSIAWFWISTAYVGYRLNETDVYVASTDIKAGEQITDDKVKAVRIPRNYVHPKAFFSRQDLVGKYVKEGYGFVTGDIILSNQVSADPPQVMGDLLPGERRIAIPTDLVRAVGGELKTGSRVDVYFVPKEQEAGRWGEGGQSQASKLILENVRVLMAKDTSARPAVVAEGADGPAPVQSSSDIEGTRAVPATVILAVTPQQVDILLQYASQGGFWLVERSPEQEGIKG